MRVPCYRKRILEAWYDVWASPEAIRVTMGTKPSIDVGGKYATGPGFFKRVAARAALHLHTQP